MGKVSKFIGAAAVTITSTVGGIMDSCSMTAKPGDRYTQQSSHYEQRADDRSRRRTRNVMSGTRSAGNRKRGSGQRSEKPAHLDHRYNG